MTSRHSSNGGRRGIAPWIIVTLIVVVLVGAGTAAYVWIISDDEESQAACTSQVVLPVVAAPGAAAAVTAAATAFDATAPVARSACVSTTVTTLPNPAVDAALTSGWQQQSTAAPGMWVTDSEAALSALEDTDSALTAGRDTSPMATSPVVIAVRTDDASSVTDLSWQDLPTASGPTGTITLPDGRHLVLALPNPSTNRATSYALQSMIAAGAGTDDTVSDASVDGAAAQLAALAAGGPAKQPATTQEALTQLAAGTGGFTAVPVVESDLVTFSRTTPGLTGISPSGPTVGDAVYPVPLTASWVNPTLDDAAAKFLAYLRGPGGDQAFTDNGFVVAGAPSGGSTTSSPSTSQSAGTSQSPGTGQSTTAVVPDAGQQVSDALATAIGTAG